MNEWWRSAREAAELAMTPWIRSRPNSNSVPMRYSRPRASARSGMAQTFPSRSWVRFAYRDRLIRSADHPVVQRLRGLPDVSDSVKWSWWILNSSPPATDRNPFVWWRTNCEAAGAFEYGGTVRSCAALRDGP